MFTFPWLFTASESHLWRGNNVKFGLLMQFSPFRDLNCTKRADLMLFYPHKLLSEAVKQPMKNVIINT